MLPEDRVGYRKWYKSYLRVEYPRVGFCKHPKHNLEQDTLESANRTNLERVSPRYSSSTDGGWEDNQDTSDHRLCEQS